MLGCYASKSIAAIVGICVFLVWNPAIAASGGEIRGVITSAVNGKPVEGVLVYLEGPAPAQQTTDVSGRYDFKNLPQGTYTIDAEKAGYSASSSGNIQITDGRIVEQSFVVAPTSLKVLGQVRVSTQPVLQTAPQVYTNIGVAQMREQGITRVSDYLRNLPGVNSFTTATPGDDVGLNLRGFSNLETLALINGHYVARNEDRYGMNYSDTPIFGLKASQVVYGAGAVGFYGVDAVGGIVNLETIEPTLTPENTFDIGFGTYNAKILGFQSTGTQGKLGYALAWGQNTTNGPIDTRLVFNPPYAAGLGCAGGSPSNCGFYVVDQTTVRRSGVLSLRFAPDPNSTLTLTGVTMHAWDDGSGNGANDLLLSQFASPGSQGPQGSGPVWLETGINDGEVRYAKRVGSSLIVLDGFQSHFQAGRNYQFNTPPAWLQGFSTVRGLTISDQIFLNKHTLGLGFYTQSAHDYLNSFSQDPSSGAVSYSPFSAYYVNNNVFFKDDWQVTPKLALDSNLWIKHSQLTHSSHLDPRLAFVYRPDSNNVWRLSASGGQTYPSAYVTAATFNPIATVNFVCASDPSQPAQAQIGNAPSVTARPETSRDIELAYGHRAANGATFQANVYDTVLYNQLLGTSVAASTFGPNYLPAGYLAQLNGPRNPCGVPITLNNVIATVTENLGRSRYRGIEAEGSLPIARTVSFNAAYNVQIATPEFIDQTVYANSPGLIIGSQYYLVPAHKGSVGLRLDDPRGVSGDLIGYFSGPNNPNNLPGYLMLNGDIRLKLGHGHITLSAVNMLGKFAYDYGMQFLGTPQAQQPGNPPVPTELFGLPPPSAMIQYEITTR